MEENLSTLAVTHLLQHTLRSLCIHENSQWVYAVFWRILPRNYPPPKWEDQGAFDRSRGNRRNWILVWEDGFCNFAASTTAEIESGECPGSSVYSNCEFQQYQVGLQPELFFKMSHEIYNYGEGLIGKVGADQGHKWIYKEPNDRQEINFLSTWQINSADLHPRTWEAQFQSGIKTIALIAVREGVVQLGATSKVIEDLSYVVLLRKKFSYIGSIPGVLLPHPSSSPYPFKVDGYGSNPEEWQFIQNPLAQPSLNDHLHQHNQFYNHYSNHRIRAITPSMSSLEALLSKLPSVVSPPSQAAPPPNNYFMSNQRAFELVAKEEIDEEAYSPRQPQPDHNDHVGESSTSNMSVYNCYQHNSYRHGQDNRM